MNKRHAAADVQKLITWLAGMDFLTKASNIS